MNKPVITLSELDGVPWGPQGASDRFGAHLAPVGTHLGLTGIGASLTTVEPGKSAFPFHNHLANDEMFVILEGSGTYRFGAESYSVTAGMVCGAPKGGRDTAHQLINTGETPLRYLALSTKRDPEIVEYPDSGKFAAISVFPGQDFFTAYLKEIRRDDDTMDYWDGEEV